MVKKLVVINGPHPDAFLKALYSRPRQLLKSWYMFYFQLPFIPEYNMYASIKRFLDGIASTGNGGYTPDVINHIHASLMQERGITGPLNYYRAFLRYGKGFKSAAVNSPTLVIWGEQDTALEKSVLDPDLMPPQSVPGLQMIKYLPNLSHWVPVADPESVKEAVISFFKK